MPESVRPTAWSRWRLPLLAVLVVAIVAVPFAVLQWLDREVAEANAMVEHTRDVESTALSLIYDARNIEAASLALAAGIDTPLVRSRLDTSLSGIPAALARLAELTVDNGAQQLRIGRLSAILEQRNRIIEEIARSQDVARRGELVESLVRGLPIREVAAEIIQSERSLLDRRTTQATRQAAIADTVRWAALLAQLLLLGAVTYLAQRQIGQRLVAEREQRRASDRAPGRAADRARADRADRRRPARGDAQPRLCRALRLDDQAHRPAAGGAWQVPPGRMWSCRNACATCLAAAANCGTSNAARPTADGTARTVLHQCAAHAAARPATTTSC